MYHHCLLVLVSAAPIGHVLPMDSAQEVQLDSMLGHSVLELVKELTAAGQAEAPLIQLPTDKSFKIYCLRGTNPEKMVIMLSPLRWESVLL